MMGSELTTNDDTIYTHNKIANALILRKTFINFIHKAMQLFTVVAIAAAATAADCGLVAAAAICDDFLFLI